MKVLLLGRTGQLGRELLASVPAGVEVIAWSSAELDLRDQAAVGERIRAAGPDAVINAAAYTAVDRAEQEAAAAFAVNARGAATVAEAAHGLGAYLVHLSTDFVFDGCKSLPYLPADPARPLGVYGASKRAGEEAVATAAPTAAILRTAWLYSRHGRNFVKTMLGLLAAGPPVRVVVDQVGSPTWAAGLAAVVWRLLAVRPAGIFHWSDAGVASWYDLATAVGEEALALGLLTGPAAVIPVAGTDYPTLARRPAYSVLDKAATYTALGMEPVHWRVMLRRMLRQYRERGEDD